MDQMIPCEPGDQICEIWWKTKCNKYTGVVGAVLEMEPPFKFSHTFKFTHLDDPPCKVTYL